jgi:DNA-binding NtrC family response regulator
MAKWQRGRGRRVRETAQRAGIGERSLYELMRRHHLNKEDFRPGRPGGE